MVEDLRTEVLSPTWCRWPSGQCYLEGIGSKGPPRAPKGRSVFGDSPSLFRFGEGNAPKNDLDSCVGSIVSLGQTKSLGFYHCYSKPTKSVWIMKPH